LRILSPREYEIAAALEEMEAADLYSASKLDRHGIVMDRMTRQ